MLVIEAELQSQVEDYLAGDPYMVGRLFQSVSITGFNWGLGRREDGDG